LEEVKKSKAGRQGGEDMQERKEGANAAVAKGQALQGFVRAPPPPSPRTSCAHHTATVCIHAHIHTFIASCDTVTTFGQRKRPDAKQQRLSHIISIATAIAAKIQKDLEDFPSATLKNLQLGFIQSVMEIETTSTI
jgi:hypothetical protein